MFAQFILQAYTTFDKKSNLIYKLVVVGLLLSLSQSTLAFIMSNVGNDSRYTALVVININWFLMVQVVTWLYVLRINSIGRFTESRCNFNVMKAMPYVVAVLQIPCIVVRLIQTDSFNSDTEQYLYFLFTRGIFSFAITAIEVYMYFALMGKLDFLLEYKPMMKKKLAWHLRVNCCLVIILEVVLAFLRIAYPINYAFSPIIYLVRVNVIINFYNALITDANRDSWDNQLSSSYCSRDIDIDSQY